MDRESRIQEHTPFRKVEQEGNIKGNLPEPVIKVSE